MLVYKTWQYVYDGGLKAYNYDGWFLLGFIPLYIRRIQTRGVR